MFPKWFMLINLLFGFAHLMLGLYTIFRKTGKKAKWLPKRVTNSKKSMITIGIYEILTGILFFTILAMSLLEYTIVNLSIVLIFYFVLSLIFWVYYQSDHLKNDSIKSNFSK